MIDLRKFGIFNKNISTLKETSYDTANKHSVIDLEEKVINFDKVKEDYFSQLGIKDVTLRSNDALFIKNRSKATFIEFKNGDLKSERTTLKEKITHSLLIFTDITNTALSFTRENLNYILVYNESENQNASTMQPSQNRTKVASSVSKLGNKKLIRFNLECWEKLFFKEVFTYTEEEFKDNVVSK